MDVVVPALGESVAEATVGQWLKQPGDPVKADEPIVSLETDKVAVEVPAPADGVLVEQLAQPGETVAVGAVIARIEPGAAGRAPTLLDATPAPPPTAGAPPAAPPPAATAAPPAVAAPGGAPQPTPTPTAAAPPASTTLAWATPASAVDRSAEPPKSATQPAAHLHPAAARIVEQYGLDPDSIPGDRPITKAQVLAAIEAGVARRKEPPPAPIAAAPLLRPRMEERVRMSRLRQTIARRLKEAQNTAAMLTTFNDVDMSAVIRVREAHQESFMAKHGVRLGFMSFFVKAATLALRDVPQVNAAIEGDEIVFRTYADIGIAVSSPAGLVVPILKDADTLSFAECERRIADFGRRAREGRLTLEELQGGTFTISNGGVFGSLLSTPILNPPQSAVLGMHRIEERPVVRAGQVVVRPMMYLALTYDHRLIDGREAVTFLVRIKEAIEDPLRLLVDL
ncbi:MAG: 2-oxoglutarate dehydrogenase complex dihydrolipoyllysine-residue succinyltransferase [Sphingomonadaceae bacterium]|nr:2-oxoglutarate dehydrogenase complex dihydrolipoyllysine-residue succinyltransferase [Sphingomonadaceae bacterium]